MAVREMLSFVRKHWLEILIAIVMQIPFCVRGNAQFQGYFAQQTVTNTFTQDMAATPTRVAINNIGQAAHTILLSSSGSDNCVVTLDASKDGNQFFVLASTIVHGPSLVGVSANGYFPVLRLTLNFESNAACAGANVTGTYIGYQFPLPTISQFAPGSIGVLNNLTSPVLFFGFTPTVAPWQVSELDCSNPGAAVAYLEMFDAATTPTLGTGMLFEIGIPAGGALTLTPTSPWTGTSAGWIGAATTPTGSTAVSTAVVCSAKFTNDAVVWPGAVLLSP